MYLCCCLIDCGLILLVTYLQPNDSVPIRSRAKQNGHAKEEPTNGDEDTNKNEILKLAQERSAVLKLANEEKERGNKLVSAKEYSNAIPHYSKAIELNSKDPAFFLNRALCLLRLEKYEAAICDCDCALRLDQTLTKAHFRRMQSHIHLERYDDAMGDCIQMIKMDSGNPDLRKEFDRIKQLKIKKEGGGAVAKKSVQVLDLKKKPEVEEVSAWEPRPKKWWSKYGVDEEEVRFQDKAPHLRSKVSFVLFT